MILATEDTAGHSEVGRAGLEEEEEEGEEEDEDRT